MFFQAFSKGMTHITKTDEKDEDNIHHFTSRVHIYCYLHYIRIFSCFGFQYENMIHPLTTIVETRRVNVTHQRLNIMTLFTMEPL